MNIDPRLHSKLYPICKDVQLLEITQWTFSPAELLKSPQFSDASDDDDDDENEVADDENAEEEEEINCFSTIYSEEGVSCSRSIGGSGDIYSATGGSWSNDMGQHIGKRKRPCADEQQSIPLKRKYRDDISRQYFTDGWTTFNTTNTNNNSESNSSNTSSSSSSSNNNTSTSNISKKFRDKVSCSCENGNYRNNYIPCNRHLNYPSLNMFYLTTFQNLDVRECKSTFGLRFHRGRDENIIRVLELVKKFTSSDYQIFTTARLFQDNPYVADSMFSSIIKFLKFPQIRDEYEYILNQTIFQDYLSWDNIKTRFKYLCVKDLAIFTLIDCSYMFGWGVER